MSISINHVTNDITSSSGNVLLNGAVAGGTIVQSTTTATTLIITPTAGTCTQYEVTALDTAATVAASTGTPTDGQRLTLRIKDNGTARALLWNAIYRQVGVGLPGTTVAGKVLYVGFIYNSQDSFWDAVSVAQL